MRPMNACARVRGMPLDVRHMRHVLALSDHGNFARAATALEFNSLGLDGEVGRAGAAAADRLR